VGGLGPKGGSGRLGGFTGLKTMNRGGGVMQGRAPRQDCPRGRPDRPGRAGAPDPCSDTPPCALGTCTSPL